MPKGVTRSLQSKAERVLLDVQALWETLINKRREAFDEDVEWESLSVAGSGGDR